MLVGLGQHDNDTLLSIFVHMRVKSFLVSMLAHEVIKNNM